MMYFQRFAFCLILAIIFAGCSNSSPKGPNKLLLISFDGFKHDYFERTSTPHFDEFIAQGFRADGLIPVFPSKTFPNHYSIVTGLYPENSGIISNTMYDREMEKTYRISDREAVENPAWYMGEPIWNTAERQGLRAGTLFWVGSEAPINGKHASYYKIYDENWENKARIDTVMEWFSQSSNPVDFATLYFEFVDTKGHNFGPDHDTIDYFIRQADEIMGYLKMQMKERGLWDKTNILIVSDHGMSELSADRVVLVDQIIDITRVQMVDWTPVSMINFNDSSYRDEAIAKLKLADEELDGFRLFLKEDIPDYWHLKNNSRTTDAILVANNGWTLTSRNRLNRFIEGLPSGTHGFDSRERDMHGIFIARGPNVKKGSKTPPIENVHIYAMMCKLLGIEPAPNDGELKVLEQVIR
jgi:ectonucleotide pyrophosphatase/phosphodiesterase family member 5